MVKTLKQALKKVYEVRGYKVGKNNNTYCVVTFPICLAEKFIKIRVVKHSHKEY